jgi:hypothetical protein
MQEINYSSLPVGESHKKSSRRAVFEAALTGLISIVVIVGGMLLFKSSLASLDTLITALDVLLFVVFVVLLWLYFYGTQLKRDKLLRRFAADNQFTFQSYGPYFGKTGAPHFDSDSTLLSEIHRFGYHKQAQSNMTLSGVYRGLNFSLSIVSMSAQRSGSEGSVTFFGVITITSDKFHNLPHVIALSKSGNRLTSALNFNAVDSPEWRQELLGWQADAYYDVYTNENKTISDDKMPNVLANIHQLDGSDVEINQGKLYVITIDGIDYTQEGMAMSFKGLDAVADAYEII